MAASADFELGSVSVLATLAQTVEASPRPRPALDETVDGPSPPVVARWFQMSRVEEAPT